MPSHVFSLDSDDLWLGSCVARGATRKQIHGYVDFMLKARVLKLLALDQEPLLTSYTTPPHIPPLRPLRAISPELPSFARLSPPGSAWPFLVSRLLEDLRRHPYVGLPGLYKAKGRIAKPAKEAMLRSGVAGERVAFCTDPFEQPNCNCRAHSLGQISLG